MGAEARCFCRSGADQGDVVALLETNEIILRGALKRRFSLSSMSEIHVEDDGLHFRVASETVRLALGAGVATRWAAKMATPPPSLRHKLGIGVDARAFVFGDILATPIEDAVRGVSTTIAEQAALMVARVRSETELTAAIVAHAAMPASSPLWIVHDKGRSAAFGENAVRQAMRASGFIDTKVAAVSADLTATRYSSRR